MIFPSSKQDTVGKKEIAFYKAKKACHAVMNKNNNSYSVLLQSEIF
jgi:hypothetical protein